jgi:hypothetical protein
MKASLLRMMAGLVGLLLIAMPAASGAQGTSSAYGPAQLDQLLAPIALYPDQLVTQILMASTYPLEVVEASRWVQDPANARLRGDQLTAALDAQDWDPSVKALVPFPDILRMMDGRLDWMQQLGDAFLTQQADVMDAVQRLRAKAQSAGTLQSTPEQTVATQGSTIAILPANPQVAYLPAYDPMMAYGPWPYPAYPPVYFPPPWGYFAGPQIVFGVGFVIVPFLWNWCEPDWHHRQIHVDVHRFNDIDRFFIVHQGRPELGGEMWTHDPYHRRGVPYRNPEVRARFQPNPGASPDARHYVGGSSHGQPTATPLVQHVPGAGGPAIPPPQPGKHLPTATGALPPQATGHPPAGERVVRIPPSAQPPYTPSASGAAQPHRPVEQPGMRNQPMTPPPSARPGMAPPPGAPLIIYPTKP